MEKQFWVIGGEFRCLAFREIAGAPSTLGPFENYETAEKVWRDRTEASRSSAATRFTIVENAANPRRMQRAA